MTGARDCTDHLRRFNLPSSYAREWTEPALDEGGYVLP